MAKKISQLPADNNFTKQRVLFSGDPLTGKLYQVSYEEVRSELLAPVKLQITGNSSYLIAAGDVVEKIMITPLSTCIVRIGTTNGGQQILPETEITAGSDYTIRIDINARTNKTIYFTGIVSNTTIAIYLGKL